MVEAVRRPSAWGGHIRPQRPPLNAGSSRSGIAVRGALCRVRWHLRRLDRGTRGRWLFGRARAQNVGCITSGALERGSRSAVQRQRGVSGARRRTNLATHVSAAPLATSSNPRVIAHDTLTVCGVTQLRVSFPESVTLAVQSTRGSGRSPGALPCVRRSRDQHPIGTMRTLRRGSSGRRLRRA
jgi:hypothetical protein